MPLWECKASSTILIPSGPSGHHLHVILNDPVKFDGYTSDQCVLIGVSTIREAPIDNTRIVDPGRHPFIINQSFVEYRHARLEPSDKLIGFVNNQYFIPRDPVDKGLLEEIIGGIYESKHTPRYIRELGI